MINLARGSSAIIKRVRNVRLGRTVDKMIRLTKLCKSIIRVMHFSVLNAWGTANEARIRILSFAHSSPLAHRTEGHLNEIAFKVTANFEPSILHHMGTFSTPSNYQEKTKH